MRKKQILARVVGIQNENWGNHAFFYRFCSVSIESCHTLLCVLHLFPIIVPLMFSEKCVVRYPLFSIWIPIVPAKIYFFLIIISHAKIALNLVGTVLKIVALIKETQC